MPIYDFQCLECEEVHEENIPMSEAESEMELGCEKCTTKTLHKKLIGCAGFKLIGECWSTDNFEYDYTKCKANDSAKGSKHKVLRHRGLDKKLKGRGFLADKEE